MNKVCKFVFLITFTVCVLGQDTADDPMDPVRGPNEDCLRCICHARSGCYRLRNCANYSISRAYWERAGRPTVLDDDPDDPASYLNCVKDDGCIMRVIRGYLASMVDRDCNCDGKIDCKDYAAIHLKGDQCRSDFNRVQLQRLDTCLTSRGFKFNRGWSVGCSVPDPQ